MKYVKMLALAAVAVGALMAFVGAGTASASKICSTKVDPCPAGQNWPVGTVIDFSLKKGTSAILTDTTGEVINTCTGSTVKGKITNAGSSTATVTGTIEELTWTGCSFTTTTNHKGCLEIHNISKTFNGTVTSDPCDIDAQGRTNTEVTINTVFFGSCVYGIAAGKSIGDLTEGKYVKEKEETAVFTANAVATKLSGSNFACPETAKWEATYVLTAPENTTLAVTAG